MDVDELLRDGRIGLYVVAALARRHGIRVRLQNNIYGGTQAVVVLPNSLLDPTDRALPGSEPAPAAVPGAVADPGPRLALVPSGGPEATVSEYYQQQAPSQQQAPFQPAPSAQPYQAPQLYPAQPAYQAPPTYRATEPFQSAQPYQPGQAQPWPSPPVQHAPVQQAPVQQTAAQQAPALPTRRSASSAPVAWPAPESAPAAWPAPETGVAGWPAPEAGPAAWSAQKAAPDPASRPPLPRRQAQAGAVTEPLGRGAGADRGAGQVPAPATLAGEPPAGQLTGLMADFLRGVSRAEDDEPPAD
jgi:hypothetical protein